MAKSRTFSRIKSPGSAIKASGLFQENENGRYCILKNGLIIPGRKTMIGGLPLYRAADYALLKLDLRSI